MGQPNYTKERLEKICGHWYNYAIIDSYCNYQRFIGNDVFQPFGYDAFGLPAEQYALKTGRDPRTFTYENIANYKRQIIQSGKGIDWDREIATADKEYFKWTQWIFKKLYEHGLAVLKDVEVNFCEALGTVLANDEIELVQGKMVSERGKHPVVKKAMRQWVLKITSFADRLLDDLEDLQWPEYLKDMQRNWIGKSQGAMIEFKVLKHPHTIDIFTTRPDTIYGATYIVLAPEHKAVLQITSEEELGAVLEYIDQTKQKMEMERSSDKSKTGVFTGAFALNPLTHKKIPIWIGEYVLPQYGTGAIMAVPCGDERDFKFATHFNIPVTNIIGDYFDGQAANPTKEARLQNSGFLNGLQMSDAIGVAIDKLEELGIGKRQTNYKMRDAAFSRQRYWGEPFPIVWKDEVAVPLPESSLPILLPEMSDLKPGPDAQGPLANLPEWASFDGGTREVNTMPGYAGSSWYFLRYMDPNNTKEFCSRKASDYWGQVDLYIGGTEHAVGHLLYSRMWTKALCDLGYIGFDEPFKRLLNQGKIGGDSRLVYRIRGTQEFVSAGLKEQYETDELHVDVSLVDGFDLDMEAFKKWKPDFANATFITENGVYKCGGRLEKMSKRYFNVVNPDDIVEKYGADTFRLYEMFLGPVEQDKPWDTKGIEGVHRFLRKLWRLFNDDIKGAVWSNEKATDAELKILHRTIKKIEEDTEKFSFNTAVSAFMICINEISEVKCHKKEVLEKILILLAPYAPHIAEELWQQLGNEGFVIDATFPTFDASLLVESSKEYPISINGKVRTNVLLSLSLTQEEVEQWILANETVQKWLEGKPPKRIIYVKNKMINVVI
jgi:leucyl-tRNA synthetase